VHILICSILGVRSISLSPSATHSSSRLSWVSTVSWFSRKLLGRSSCSDFVDASSDELSLDPSFFSDRSDEEDLFTN
jgi:hypothetical protein